ncbi:hypothetical protein E5D57_007091 [Metarhizium anisopliae]|nr:hypothetical protein E5D57_007091 [Metarhizium anisopliae]
MSLQKKPQAASRPYPQPDVGGSASRDHRNGLANQDEIESGLRKHPFYAHDVSSPQDLNRYSRIHIGPEYANAALTVQTQSQDSKRHEPGNLAMRRHKPELQLQSSTASVPHKLPTPAVRRRRPELSLQNSTLSTPYRATPVDFGKTHVTQDNVRAADVPRRKSIRKSAVVGALSTSSLANPPSLQKVGADSQERRNTPAKPALAKLGLMPLSPLNLSFVDKRQNSTPASTSDRHASRDPGSSSRSTLPQSSAERPVSAVGDARPALSYIPMRRRSLAQTPGLATRTPARYRLPGGRSSFRSSTSLASVLAGAAPTGAEAGKDAGSEGKRKIQRHMSLPDLQMKAEQERSVTPSDSDYQQLGGLKLGTLRITNFSSVPRRMRDSNGGKQTQSTTAKSKNGIGARNAGFRLGSQSVPNLSNPTLSTTNATKNGTKDHLNGNPSVSFSSKRHRRFSFGDTPGAASSRKRLSILRELIEEPLDDYDFMREVSSSHPQAVKEDSCNQNQNQIAATEDNAALKHFADEILDTSDDSSVNHISDSSEIKPANDVDPYDISRPDSGFISASSSLSSPGSPSQTDSGYSSSTSIQSKPALVASGVADKTALEGLSGRDTNNMGDDKDGTVRHQTEDDSLNGPHRDSVISLSRSSMRLLSSLIRPRHSLAVSGTGDDGSQLDQNGSNSNNDTLQSKDISVSQDGTVQPRVRSNSGSQLAGKLQRLFAHHKEDDLSTGYGSHDLRAVPTVPVDVEERLSEHNRSDSTITRGDDTKIFHIEALLDGPGLEAEDNDTHLQRTTTPVAIPAALPMEEAYQDAFIGEKPVPPPRNPSRQSRKIGNHKAILEASRNVTEKAAPQEAFTTLQTQDNRFMKNERAILPASQTARTHISSGLDVYRARAPVSAPNLSNSFYSNSEAAAKSVSRLTVADLTKELPPEPPRDDLLRSSFSTRPWQQKRLAERKWLQNNNQESVRSYEFHHNHVRSQTTTVMGREQTQVVQDHISVFMSQRRHSTLIHRPAFSESLAIASLERPKDEPQPPYRVLHSYNSPAYKNIPIWA